MDGKLAGVLRKYHGDIVTDWVREQLAPGGLRPGLIAESELRANCDEFLGLLVEAVSRGSSDPVSPDFAPLRDLLTRLSRNRNEQGFKPSETALFVLSLKKPLFARLRRENEGAAPNLIIDEIWAATVLIDRLALITTEAFQKEREAVIISQQAEMLELSTPIMKLWDGILALPLIGTLDSHRTQVVMEALLQRVVETSCDVVIIDITGVPTVDTLVAKHLLKTISAARLMGVECVISGIRPQIAQTIVHLGVELAGVTTKASLADAFRFALSRRGAPVPLATGPSQG